MCLMAMGQDPSSIEFQSLFQKKARKPVNRRNSNSGNASSEDKKTTSQRKPKASPEKK